MKPKPLASLNHFTVPVVRMFLPLDDVVLCSECGNAVLTDTTLFVNDALTMRSTTAVDGQIINEKRTLACCRALSDRSEPYHANRACVAGANVKGGLAESTAKCCGSGVLARFGCLATGWRVAGWRVDGLEPPPTRRPVDP